MASGTGTVPFRTYSTNDFIKRFMHLAQSSQFRAVLQVSRLPFTKEFNPQGGRFYDDLSILCTNATLPGSSFSTTENSQDFYGVNQKFAYRRDFDDLSLDFYVDAKYQVMKFYETWMDWIATPGTYETVGTDQHNTNNVYRFNYPNDYKVTIDIHKFDKDYEKVSAGGKTIKETGTRNDILYTFINAFPLSIASVPVSYDASQLLKLSVTFAYDRYFLNKNSKAIQEAATRGPILAQNFLKEGNLNLPSQNIG